MSPQTLAKAIDTLAANADAAYVTSIGKVQDRLYNQLVAVLKELELDDEGYILQNGTNRKILSTATDKINEVFKSSLYVSAVNNYINVIPKIDLQNVKYFTAIDEGFKLNRVFIKNLQAEAIATVERFVLRDGLASQVINPLSQILNSNVNSGGKFSGFLDQIRTFVLGNDQVEGRALSYSKTYLSNSLFQYSRAFQQSVTADLGLVWYRYTGGVIDRSRDFCIERNGNFYHQKEVESWANLTWKGKDPLTTSSSIFILAGGFSCRHELIPVSESIVPQTDLDRIS